MIRPDIDIVIPLYNEADILAKNVAILMDFLVANRFPYRYIVTLANNASTDGSLAVCQGLAERYREVRVLNLTERGKGRAIKRAWSTSEALVLVFMDADLSSDIKFLLPLVEAVLVEHFSLAIGNRLGRRSKVVSRRFVRKMASYFYNILVRFLFWTDVSDHQCGFKAISRKAFGLVQPLLLDDDWFFDTELIVMALRCGLKIKAIDIVWVDHTTSKVSLGSTSYAMWRAVWRLRKRLNCLAD